MDYSGKLSHTGYDADSLCSRPNFEKGNQAKVNVSCESARPVYESKSTTAIHDRNSNSITCQLLSAQNLCLTAESSNWTTAFMEVKTDTHADNISIAANSFSTNKPTECPSNYLFNRDAPYIPSSCSYLSIETSYLQKDSSRGLCAKPLSTACSHLTDNHSTDAAYNTPEDFVPSCLNNVPSSEHAFVSKYAPSCSPPFTDAPVPNDCHWKSDNNYSLASATQDSKLGSTSPTKWSMPSSESLKSSRFAYTNNNNNIPTYKHQRFGSKTSYLRNKALGNKALHLKDPIRALQLAGSMSDSVSGLAFRRSVPKFKSPMKPKFSLNRCKFKDTVPKTVCSVSTSADTSSSQVQSNNSDEAIIFCGGSTTSAPLDRTLHSTEQGSSSEKHSLLQGPNNKSFRLPKKSRQTGKPSLSVRNRAAKRRSVVAQTLDLACETFGLQTATDMKMDNGDLICVKNVDSAVRTKKVRKKQPTKTTFATGNFSELKQIRQPKSVKNRVIISGTSSDCTGANLTSDATTLSVTDEQSETAISPIISLKPVRANNCRQQLKTTYSILNISDSKIKLSQTKAYLKPKKPRPNRTFSPKLKQPSACKSNENDLCVLSDLVNQDSGYSYSPEAATINTTSLPSIPTSFSTSTLLLSSSNQESTGNELMIEENVISQPKCKPTIINLKCGGNVIRRFESSSFSSHTQSGDKTTEGKQIDSITSPTNSLRSVFRSDDFLIGEHVLCYEPELDKPKLLYSSRIIDVTETPASGGCQLIKYFRVHFRGCGEESDHVVTNDYLLKDTPTNRSLKKQLAVQSRSTNGTNVGRKRKCLNDTGESKESRKRKKQLKKLNKLQKYEQSQYDKNDQIVDTTGIHEKIESDSENIFYCNDEEIDNDRTWINRHQLLTNVEENKVEIDSNAKHIRVTEKIEENGEIVKCNQLDVEQIEFQTNASSRNMETLKEPVDTECVTIMNTTESVLPYVGKKSKGDIKNAKKQLKNVSWNDVEIKYDACASKQLLTNSPKNRRSTTKVSQELVDNVNDAAKKEDTYVNSQMLDNIVRRNVKLKRRMKNICIQLNEVNLDNMKKECVNSSLSSQFLANKRTVTMKSRVKMARQQRKQLDIELDVGSELLSTVKKNVHPGGSLKKPIKQQVHIQQLNGEEIECGSKFFANVHKNLQVKKCTSLQVDVAINGEQDTYKEKPVLRRLANRNVMVTNDMKNERQQLEVERRTEVIIIKRDTSFGKQKLARVRNSTIENNPKNANRQSNLEYDDKAVSRRTLAAHCKTTTVCKKTGRNLNAVANSSLNLRPRVRLPRNTNAYDHPVTVVNTCDDVSDQRLDNCVFKSIREDVDKPEVVFSDKVRHLLTQDRILVHNKGMRYRLPGSPNIVTLLEMYVCWYVQNDIWDFLVEHDGLLTSSYEDILRRMNLLKEFVDSVRVCCNHFARRLFYENEKNQYFDYIDDLRNLEEAELQNRTPTNTAAFADSDRTKRDNCTGIVNMTITSTTKKCIYKVNNDAVNVDKSNNNAKNRCNADNIARCDRKRCIKRNSMEMNGNKIPERVKARSRSQGNVFDRKPPLGDNVNDWLPNFSDYFKFPDDNEAEKGICATDYNRVFNSDNDTKSSNNNNGEPDNNYYDSRSNGMQGSERRKNGPPSDDEDETTAQMNKRYAGCCVIDWLPSSRIQPMTSHFADQQELEGLVFTNVDGSKRTIATSSDSAAELFDKYKKLLKKTGLENWKSVPDYVWEFEKYRTSYYYGAPYLGRLLVILPEIIKPTHHDTAQKRSIFNQLIESLLDFICRHEWFDKRNYYQAIAPCDTDSPS